MVLLSLPVVLLAGERYALIPFAVTAVAALLPGQLLYWTFRRAPEMQLRHAMVTVTLAWVLIPLVGMLPFLLIAGHLAGQPGTPATVTAFAELWNALFEAVSGFTSTGLSVAVQPSALPKGLQWWRSVMEWVGGVGVIVLMLAVFHHSAEAGRLLYSEARDKKILPDVSATVRTTWWVFLLYTAAGVLLLRLAGMPWWEALNYGMTGIATGGFGVTDGSMAAYGAGPRLAMMLLMLLGAISFAVHYKVLVKGQVSLLWNDPESRALFVLLACGAGLVVLENLWARGMPLWFDSVFQWVSALCTAGFSTVSLSEWSISAQLLLVLGMVIGGAAGATTGGLKLRRVLWLARAAFYRIERVSLHPWLLMEHKPLAEAEERGLSGPHIEAAVTFASLWALTIAFGTLALLHFAGPAATLNGVLFEVASALGNVGLSSGITTPDLHWGGKLTLILIMWMGRLEILPVLVLLSAAASRRPWRAPPLSNGKDRG